MRDELYFAVSGIPAPQGSKNVYNGRLVESSKKVGPWRAAVSQAVAATFQATGNGDMFTDPVEIWVTFYLPRPRTVKRLLPSIPPDLDKLERGLFDALTIAGVWSDDSLVVKSHATKLYDDGHEPGAVIAIKKFQEVPIAIYV